LQAQANSQLYDKKKLSCNDSASRNRSTTSIGKGWHNVEAAELDEKEKTGVKLLQMRNFLDPKRFYKNPDKGGKILHVGTVVEGATEFKSSRLTKKERKTSFVDEILSDQKTRNYTKRVFMDIQEVKGNKKKFQKAAKKARKAKAKKAYF
jgi:hypothetical protein